MRIIFNISYVAVLLVMLSYLLWLLFFKKKDRQLVKIRDASLTGEELETHAREIALEHTISKKISPFIWPMPRMNDNYKYIISVYKEMNEDVMGGINTTPAAEWLLDNFYIIEEQAKGIRRDITKKDYSKLPILSTGHLKGNTRIYAIALELVSHTDGRIDEHVLLRYIDAYQSNNVLTIKELWALPTMIKLALIENIRYICERSTQTQRQRRRVEEILEDFDENNENMYKLISSIDAELKGKYQVSSAFIEHLAYRFRKMGKSYSHVLGYIDERLNELGTSVDAVTHKEHNEQIVRKASIGNCIISLKYISTTNWVDMFGKLSHVENILKNDPIGVYSSMDLSTQNYYREKVMELASQFSVSETHVAKKSIELANNALEFEGESGSKKVGHVGFYLVGKGIGELEKEIGYDRTLKRRMAARIGKSRGFLYAGSIVVPLILILAGVAYYSFANSKQDRYGVLLAALGVLVSIVPMADIVIGIVNWAINRISKPSFLPKIDMKNGIPSEKATMVVIPALLPNKERAKELIDNLEIYYLANKEQNLYFALVGDYKDSSKKEMPEDKEIIDVALKNRRAKSEIWRENNDIFYFSIGMNNLMTDRINGWGGKKRSPYGV